MGIANQMRSSLARAGARLMLGFALCLLSGCAAPSSPLAPKRAPDPTPVYSPLTLPKDEAPHQDLTEWWYYTGHLQADDGR
ncbi:MAG: hypothetical protein IT307_13435, partial [Chloroflexi bacterium]|nr:hypothetical protein [Chloroflexota bacterium]